MVLKFMQCNLYINYIPKWLSKPFPAIRSKRTLMAFGYSGKTSIWTQDRGSDRRLQNITQ